MFQANKPQKLGFIPIGVVLVSFVIAVVKSAEFKDYEKYGLEIHNLKRQGCAAPPLVLNSTLNTEAQKWADFQMKKQSFKLAPLPTRPEYNVLFFARNHVVEAKEGVKMAIDYWLGLDPDTKTRNKTPVDFSNPKATGFTQIVWKNTTNIGVGFGTREGKSVVAVTYWPPGNLFLLGSPSEKGKYFRENVPANEC